jgi:hypothetical protein
MHGVIVVEELDVLIRLILAFELEISIIAGIPDWLFPCLLEIA